MMAEVRRGEEEEHTEIHHVDNQATDHLDRSKADLLHCSTGPLSSIRVAVKRTRANSLSDNTSDPRQPAITIISAEPLDDNNWFSAKPVVFPSTAQSSWSAGIQPPPSYDQVIQEKTQEENIVQPTTPPQHSSSCTTTTCSTQTDPVREKSAGKKLQKPPRPFLPRPEHSSESGLHKSQARRDSSDQCSRSVTVHWETAVHPDLAPSVTTSSVPALETRPVPLPRIKSRKQKEDKVQTLVKLEDGELPTDAAEISSNEYLKELLEVFSPNSDQANQEEQVHGEMNSQRNIQVKIQAFESQLAPEQGSASEPIRPKPLPRKQVKPPVSAKPPQAARTLFVQDSQNVSSRDQTPVFKPQPPQKSAGKPVREELETLLTKGGPPHRSRPAVLTRDYSIHDEEPPLPPRPPVKPPKEPLKLNINNHNSTGILRDDEYADTPANPAPAKARPAITRRPTMIRVPSQIDTDSLQGNPPPLPARKPVGSLNATAVPKQKSLPSIPTQGLLRDKRVPSLPNKQQSMRKPLPQHPPPAKPGPGRPPPPSVQATKPPKGFLLPPRPVQGHRLYDKYSLPHGSAAPDSNGSHTGELSFPAAGPTSKQENGLNVQALHDFTPEGAGELVLKAGDIINMVERVDSEWYRGTCKGSTGYFPVNFVKVLSDAPPKLAPEKKPKPLSAKVTGPRCVARFDFEGESSEELSFMEGDVIRLQAYMGDEWARGQLGAASGIFPLNFVEVVEDPPSPSTWQRGRTNPNSVALPGMASHQPEAVKPAQSLMECALAQHDFDAKAADELSFKQGDCILVTRHLDDEWSCGRLNGEEGIFPKAFVESRTGPKLSTNELEGGGVKGRAMYDFTSDCDEELSLQIGDIITNLESMDDEWFLGDLRGKRALVPKNYIQVL